MNANYDSLLPLVLLVLVLFSAQQPINAAAQDSATPLLAVATPPPPLPETVVSEVAQSLRRAVLLHSGSGTFFTASILLPYLRPLLTRSRITLLVPSDAAIAGDAAPSSPLHLISVMSPPQLRSLARFHILTSNLSFAHIRLLPDGALLPTLLGDAYRLRISVASPGQVTIGGARVIRPDICPVSVSHLITCHGIDRILSLTTGNVDVVTPDSSSSPGNSISGAANISALSPPQHRRNDAAAPPASDPYNNNRYSSRNADFTPYPAAAGAVVDNSTSSGNISLPSAAASDSSNGGTPAPTPAHSAAATPIHSMSAIVYLLLLLLCIM